MQNESPSAVPFLTRLPGRLLLSSLALAGSAGTLGLVAGAGILQGDQGRAILLGSRGNAEAKGALAVARVLPPEQGFGIVLVELEVSGSAPDPVSIQVEYDVLGDEPDRGWELAKAVEDQGTQEFGLRDIRVDGKATPLAFFWDTDVDLADRKARVRLRFTATDGLSESAPAESAPFLVDNE